MSQTRKETVTHTQSSWAYSDAIGKEALGEGFLAGRGRRLFFFLGVLILAVAGFLVSPMQSVAQDDTPEVRMGFDVWRANGCSVCHGSYAEGGAGGDAPKGPSLRETSLDSDAIAEVIRDGRNQMPSFANLSVEEIDQLLEYLMTRVVGAGDVTVEDCEFQRGEGHRLCERLR